MTEDGRKYCEELDREFGSEVLTASYSKVRLLVLAVKHDQETMDWVLDAMLTALRRQEVTPDDFKIDAYQKKANETNFIQHALTTRAVCQHLDSIASGIERVDANLGQRLKQEVVAKLKWPSDFSREFPVSKEDTDQDDDSMAEGVRGSGSEDDFLERLLNSSAPKGVILFAELFKKLHGGVYMDGISALSLEGNIPEALQALELESLGALRDDIKETMKVLHTAEAVVSTKNCGQAPQPTLRSLVRQMSDGADDESAKAERQDVWKRAVAQRKNRAIGPG